MKKVIHLALAGNPNTGKTALFNAMTGGPRPVSGRCEGVRLYKGYEIRIYDLPGVHNLTAYSPDEVMTRDFNIMQRPDVVVDVLDSTKIEQHLYLTLQFQELGVPVVAALNFHDRALRRRIRIDERCLGDVLRVPCVKTVATRAQGVAALLDKVIDAVEKRPQDAYMPSYGEIDDDIEALTRTISQDRAFADTYPAHRFAIKLLEKDTRAMEIVSRHAQEQALKDLAFSRIRRIEEHFGCDAATVVAQQRYGYIHGAIAETVRRHTQKKASFTERIDRFVLHRFFGLPLFLAVLWGMFEATFRLGSYPMEWLESFFAWGGNLVSAALPAGFLNSLLVDGVIAGVGGVLTFVPLIVLLFLFISILEETGYMARSAFIMDKFLHVFGLHGQSFLPMVMGFGCSVPAIMAARTLKSPRDRIITSLVIPFMSCSAKLPVYVLLAGAFFARNAGQVVVLVYLIGVFLSLLSALLLSRTVLKGRSVPFVMELPPYRMPALKGMLWHVREKTMCYVKKAGGVLLLASIIVWVITSFPKPRTDEARDRVVAATCRSAFLFDAQAQGVVEDRVSLQRRIEGCVARTKAHEALSASLAGQFGRMLEPVMAPLGFDGKMGIAALTGLAAREMTVSTLGVLYSIEGGPQEKERGLRQALRQDPAFTPLVAFCLMLFVLTVVPCFASLVTIYMEIGLKWLVFAIGYWSALAWSLCFVVYNIGKGLGY